MQPLPSNSVSTKTVRPWQRRLQRFFDRPWVELTIGGLIVVSVALVFLELSLPPSRLTTILIEINYAITCLFAVELTLRFLAASSKWRFFREFWIDIIAVAPIFRPLRFARLVRLLRLLRILRLIGIFSRRASNFPYIFRRGAVEYVIVSGLIVLTILFATGALLAIERRNPEMDTFTEALAYSVFTMLSGEPTPAPRQSLVSQLVTIGVMFMGMTVFAMFTGTVSAFMVERLRKEGQPVAWDEFSDHTIICGWNRRAEIIIREHRAVSRHDEHPIVVITESYDPSEAAETALHRGVYFLHDDFTRVSALKKAGVERAATCIVLAERGHNRTEQDADARTILAALTVERLNPNVYTCAELINREYGTHLEMGRVNDYVVTGEYSGYLLAQAALNRGLMGVFSELFSCERGNQFHRLPVPDGWIGRTFNELFMHLKQQYNAVLIATYDSDGRHQVNPSDFTFQGGEYLVVIASRPISI